MRNTLTLVALVLLAACGGATNPGIDPTILITNETTWPLYFEWRDGQNVLGADTIVGGVRNYCVRFFARADSAYFYAEITDPDHTVPATSWYMQPWFDPTERHAWTMLIEPRLNGSPNIVVRDTQREC
jgi:hypothetical protein